MDFYFHELARILYLKMIKGTWNETDQFKKLCLPLEGIHEVLSGETDPDEWFSKNLIQKMDTDCYQGGNKIRNLLKSIDIAVTSDLCYPEGTIWADVKKKLDEIYTARNQIAHQADRSHSNAEFYEINYDDFCEKISFCRSFVEAVHNAVIMKRTS